MPSPSRNKKSFGPARPAVTLAKACKVNANLIPDIARRLSLMDVYRCVEVRKCKAPVFDLVYALCMNDDSLDPVVGYAVDKDSGAVTPWSFVRRPSAQFECIELSSSPGNVVYMGVPVPRDMLSKGRFIFNSILSDVELIRKLSPRELEAFK